MMDRELRADLFHSFPYLDDDFVDKLFVVIVDRSRVATLWTFRVLATTVAELTLASCLGRWYLYLSLISLDVNAIGASVDEL